MDYNEVQAFRAVGLAADSLRAAVLVEPAAPHPVAIVRHVARRERPPRCPRGPVAKPLVVLDVADVYELVVVERDVDPAVDVVTPAPEAPLAVL